MRVCCMTSISSEPALLLAILSHTSASRKFFGARSWNATSPLCQSVALPLHTMGRGVGYPSAVTVAATGGVDWVLWKREHYTHGQAAAQGRLCPSAMFLSDVPPPQDGQAQGKRALGEPPKSECP